MKDLYWTPINQNVINILNLLTSEDNIYKKYFSLYKINSKDLRNT